MLNILFLCTGNSCRSIMAEGLLNHYGSGKFRGFSAGSFPTGKVHPMTIATLKRHGIKALGYESKSWDIFKNLVELNIVITVCNNAAGEVCPIFHGKPVKAHWDVADPAHFHGTTFEIEGEFDRVFVILERRIKALVELPIEQMDSVEFLHKLNEIGEIV